MVEQASSSVGLLSVLAAAVLAAAIAALLLVQARNRRQIATLLDKLEQFESARLEPTPAIAEPIESASPPGAKAGSSDLGGLLENPSGDVLHGRTTHVQRIVDGPPGAGLSLADQAIRKIHQHIAESVTPQRLASELFVSLRTLERGLGITLACTPRQLILAMKMREARRLLTSGRMVGEVAERLGFSNPFHFSRRFKEFYHVAPSAMRSGSSSRP